MATRAVNPRVARSLSQYFGDPSDPNTALYDPAFSDINPSNPYSSLGFNALASSTPTPGNGSLFPTPAGGGITQGPIIGAPAGSLTNTNQSQNQTTSGNTNRTASSSGTINQTGSRSLSPSGQKFLSGTESDLENTFANAGYNPAEIGKMDISPEEAQSLITNSLNPIAGAANAARRGLSDMVAARGNVGPGTNATFENINRVQGANSAQAQLNTRLGILQAQREAAQAEGNARIGQQNAILGQRTGLSISYPENNSSLNQASSNQGSDSTTTSGTQNTNTGTQASTTPVTGVTTAGPTNIIGGQTVPGNPITTFPNPVNPTQPGKKATPPTNYSALGYGATTGTSAPFANNSHMTQYGR